MVKKFTINSNEKNSDIAEILQYAQNALENFRMELKEKNHIMLMFEESLVKLLDHAEDSKNSHTVKVSVHKFLGTTGIEIVVPGNEFAFSIDKSPVDFSEEDDEVKDTIQNLLLGHFGSKIKYKHSKGVNFIKIEAVKSPYSFFYKTVGAIFIAIVLGIICRYFVPDNINMFLNENILKPIRDIFMNTLKIVVAPLVFFAIVNSVSQLKGLAELGKIGGQIMMRFIFMEIVACIFAGALFCASQYTGICFSQVIPDNPSTVQAVGELNTIKDVIINIFPSNFINPFLKSDMMQLIFLGIMCGLALGSLGDYSKFLRDSFNSWDQLFRKMAEMLTKFVPIAVLCSIWSVVLMLGTKLLFSLAGIIVLAWSGLLCLMLIDCVRLKIVGLSVRKFISKYIPAMAHLLATTSSGLSLVENMKAADTLGVPQKIYSFSLPLGVVFSKNGSIFYRAVTALFMAQLYGIDVSFTALISLLFSAFILPLTTTGIPGSSYVAFTVMLIQLNIPAEAIAYIIAIDAVLDIFIAVINSFEDVVSSIIVTHNFGLLDVEKYNK